MSKLSEGTGAFALLGVVVCVEAVLYLAVLGYARSTIIGGDGYQYLAIASNLAAGNGISIDGISPTMLRTPGYPLFVAAVWALAGHSLISLRIAQFLLLFFTGCILYSLARIYFDHRTSVVSALIAVTYPPSVFLVVSQLSETLATFLVVTSIWLVVKQRPIAAGCTLASLVMVRPEFVFLPFACLPFIYRQRRNAIGMIAVFVLALSPLVARNLVGSRALAPLGLGTGMSLFASSEQYSGQLTYKFAIQDWEKFRDDFLRRSTNAGSGIEGEINVDRSYKSDAVQMFRSLPISHIILSVPIRILYLWGTGDLGPEWEHLFVKWEWLLLAVGALIGMMFTRSRWVDYWPFWILCPYLTLLHLVFHVEGRYSMPARPLLFVFSSVAIFVFARLGAKPANLAEEST